MASFLLDIERRLDSIVAQSLREAADEKDIQLQTAKEIKGDKRALKATDGDKEVSEAEDETEAENEDSEEKKSDGSGGDMSKRPVTIPDELPAAITLDMVIDGIDAIRSARSLKKPDVREEFEAYFNSLSSDEKIGLLAYVYGIAETLIGDSPGRGLDPSEEPYNIQMAADPKQDDELSRVPAHKPTTSGDESDIPIVVGG